MSLRQGGLPCLNVEQAGHHPVIALGLFQDVQGLESAGGVIVFLEFLQDYTEPSCKATSRISPSFISSSRMISLRGAI